MDIIHICHFQEFYCARQKLKAESQRTEIKPPIPRKLNTDGIVILIVDKYNYFYLNRSCWNELRNNQQEDKP